MYHTCRLQDYATTDFENRLNEKWLSAYDVKFIDLSLSVSNTSTEISGTATILLEAVREMDTLVLELQDALEVLKVRISDEDSYPDFEDLTNFRHLYHTIYIPLARTRTNGDHFYIVTKGVL